MHLSPHPVNIDRSLIMVVVKLDIPDNDIKSLVYKMLEIEWANRGCKHEISLEWVGG